MAQPARKPRPAPPAETQAPDPRPQLRPRAVREAATPEAPQPNEPQRLQERIADAFAGKSGSNLENTLMRLVIVAATCLVVLSTAREGGVLGALFR